MTPNTRARTSDPATSKEAGKKVELRASQARVLNMFRLYGDMHDKQLLKVLHDAETSAGLKPMSPSGARSRRNELAAPNMERLEELRGEWVSKNGGLMLVADHGKQCEIWARTMLRREGFRSQLWDTGRRETVDGRTVIIWGLAV